MCLAATGLMATACAAPPSNVAGAPHEPQAAASVTGDRVTNAQLSISQRFRNLDEYLAWLEKTQAPVDGPWYKQIRPGVYELQTGNFRPLGSEPEKRVFTRAELEKKFGFSR
jgi:hypothetical protein